MDRYRPSRLERRRRRRQIELRLAPALDTLDELLATAEAGTFDFAFIDADKDNYDDYYERSLRLVRPGGLIASTTCCGAAAWPIRPTGRDTEAIRALNTKIAADERVDMAMLPVADGLTLARIR